MNIDKAIEILQILANDEMPPDINDFNKALDLGIEALTAIRDFRNDWSGNRFHALPGEAHPSIPPDSAAAFASRKPKGD